PSPDRPGCRGSWRWRTTPRPAPRSPPDWRTARPIAPRPPVPAPRLAAWAGDVARPVGTPRSIPRAGFRARPAAGSRSVSPVRSIEGSSIESLGRADQLGAADLGEHGVESARVVGLVFDRTARDALAVALAIDRERRGVGRADPRRETLPVGLGAPENLFRLARDA